MLEDFQRYLGKTLPHQIARYPHDQLLGRLDLAFVPGEAVVDHDAAIFSSVGRVPSIALPLGSKVTFSSG